MTDPAINNDASASKVDDAMEEDADLDVNMEPAPAEPATQENQEEDGLPEAREPTKKDVSLKEFLSKMDDYAPIVSTSPTS